MYNNQKIMSSRKSLLKSIEETDGVILNQLIIYEKYDINKLFENNIVNIEMFVNIADFLVLYKDVLNQNTKSILYKIFNIDKGSILSIKNSESYKPLIDMINTDYENNLILPVDIIYTSSFEDKIVKLKLEYINDIKEIDSIQNKKDDSENKSTLKVNDDDEIENDWDDDEIENDWDDEDFEFGDDFEWDEKSKNEFDEIEKLITDSNKNNGLSKVISYYYEDSEIMIVDLDSKDFFGMSKDEVYSLFLKSSVKPISIKKNINNLLQDLNKQDLLNTKEILEKKHDLNEKIKLDKDLLIDIMGLINIENSNRNNMRYKNEYIFTKENAISILKNESLMQEIAENLKNNEMTYIRMEKESLIMSDYTNNLFSIIEEGSISLSNEFGFTKAEQESFNSKINKSKNNKDKVIVALELRDLYFSKYKSFFATDDIKELESIIKDLKYVQVKNDLIYILDPQSKNTEELDLIKSGIVNVYDIKRDAFKRTQNIGIQLYWGRLTVDSPESEKNTIFLKDENKILVQEYNKCMLEKDYISIYDNNFRVVYDNTSSSFTRSFDKFNGLTYKYLGVEDSIKKGLPFALYEDQYLIDGKKIYNSDFYDDMTEEEVKDILELLATIDIRKYNEEFNFNKFLEKIVKDKDINNELEKYLFKEKILVDNKVIARTITQGLTIRYFLNNNARISSNIKRVEKAVKSPSFNLNFNKEEYYEIIKEEEIEKLKEENQLIDENYERNMNNIIVLENVLLDILENNNDEKSLLEKFNLESINKYIEGLNLWLDEKSIPNVVLLINKVLYKNPSVLEDKNNYRYKVLNHIIEEVVKDNDFNKSKNEYSLNLAIFASNDKIELLKDDYLQKGLRKVISNIMEGNLITNGVVNDKNNIGLILLQNELKNIYKNIYLIEENNVILEENKIKSVNKFIVDLINNNFSIEFFKEIIPTEVLYEPFVNLIKEIGLVKTYVLSLKSKYVRKNIFKKLLVDNNNEFTSLLIERNAVTKEELDIINKNLRLDNNIEEFDVEELSFLSEKISESMKYDNPSELIKNIIFNKEEYIKNIEISLKKGFLDIKEKSEDFMYIKNSLGNIFNKFIDIGLKTESLQKIFIKKEELKYLKNNYANIVKLNKEIIDNDLFNNIIDYFNVRMKIDNEVNSLLNKEQSSKELFFMDKNFVDFVDFPQEYHSKINNIIKKYINDSTIENNPLLVLNSDDVLSLYIFNDKDSYISVIMDKVKVSNLIELNSVAKSFHTSIHNERVISTKDYISIINNTSENIKSSILLSGQNVFIKNNLYLYMLLKQHDKDSLKKIISEDNLKFFKNTNFGYLIIENKEELKLAIDLFKDTYPDFLNLIVKSIIRNNTLYLEKEIEDIKLAIDDKSLSKNENLDLIEKYNVLNKKFEASLSLEESFDLNKINELENVLEIVNPSREINYLIKNIIDDEKQKFIPENIANVEKDIIKGVIKNNLRDYNKLLLNDFSLKEKIQLIDESADYIKSVLNSSNNPEAQKYTQYLTNLITQKTSLINKENDYKDALDDLRKENDLFKYILKALIIKHNTPVDEYLAQTWKSDKRVANKKEIEFLYKHNLWMNLDFEKIIKFRKSNIIRDKNEIKQFMFHLFDSIGDSGNLFGYDSVFDIEMSNDTKIKYEKIIDDLFVKNYEHKLFSLSGVNKFSDIEIKNLKSYDLILRDLGSKPMIEMLGMFDKNSYSKNLSKIVDSLVDLNIEQNNLNVLKELSDFVKINKGNNDLKSNWRIVFDLPYSYNSNNFYRILENSTDVISKITPFIRQFELNNVLENNAKKNENIKRRKI